MKWSDFSTEQKTAIIRSALHVGYCDYCGSGIGGFFNKFRQKQTRSINYCQREYLSMLMVRMNKTPSFIDEVKAMGDSRMVSVLNRMDSSKKDLTFKIWASVLCRFGGSAYYGMAICLNEFPEEYVQTIQQLARDANISIPRTFSMSEYGYL